MSDDLLKLAELCDGVAKIADEMRMAAAARGQSDKEWWHAGEQHSAKFIAGEIRELARARSAA